MLGKMAQSQVIMGDKVVFQSLIHIGTVKKETKTVASRESTLIQNPTGCLALVKVFALQGPRQKIQCSAGCVLVFFYFVACA